MTKTVDFKTHINLTVTGGQYDAAALDKGLQAAFDAGREFGRKDAEKLMQHPALASLKPGAKAEPNDADFGAMVLTHLKRINGGKA